MNAPKEPRKQPRQARAKETVRAIVDAAARILGSEGPDALTTNRIAEVAGVSVGSLYQYFPSREAVVVALVDRQLEEDLEAVTAAAVQLAQGSPREQVRGVVDLMVGRHRRIAPWLAQLLPLLPALEREQRARKMVEDSTAVLGGVLLARPEALRPDLHDPERLQIALFTTSRALRWLLNSAAMERPELLGDPRFADDLARVLDALLFRPAAPCAGDPGS